jgi:hypothetical protein
MHACTVIARNYLAHARVLAESFLEHNPGARFSVLVTDGPRLRAGGSQPFEVLTPADVGMPEVELHRRATMYHAQALVASMKPLLLQSLLARGCGPAILLDADGCVYDDLSGVAALAQSASLALSPHTMDPRPLPPDIYDSPEQIILRSGVMNAGLLAVDQGAQPFLQWWAERTARRCVFDQPRGLMLSQTWLTLAVALFDHAVLGDRGCNVAGWNLQDRDVAWDGAKPSIDGGPLRHFHFAGSYDPERPEQLTQQAHAHWWPKLQDRPGVARLSREYAARLLGAGYRQAMSQRPLYDVTPSDETIEPWSREAYRVSLVASELANREEPPNPFTHGAEAFAQWAREHAAGAVDELTRESTHAGDDPKQAIGTTSLEARELVWALSRTDDLLARIRELENIRDETIGWAEREGAARLELEAQLRDLSGHLGRKQTELDALMGSLSWSVTKPLRAIKSVAKAR